MAFSRSSYPDAGMHVDGPENVPGVVVSNVREILDAYHTRLFSQKLWTICPRTGREQAMIGGSHHFFY